MEKCLDAVFVKPGNNSEKKKKFPFLRKKRSEQKPEPYFPAADIDNSTELDVQHDSLCRPWDSESFNYVGTDYAVDDQMVDAEVPLPANDRSALTRLLVRGSRFERPEDRERPLFSNNPRIFELPASPRTPMRPKSYGDIVFRGGVKSDRNCSTGRSSSRTSSIRDLSTGTRGSDMTVQTRHASSRKVSGQSCNGLDPPRTDNFLNLCRSLARSSVILSPIDRIADLTERFEVCVVLLELVAMLWLLYQISILVKAIAMAIQTLFLPLIIISKLLGYM